MSLKLKAVSTAGILLITAFAFAQGGGQTKAPAVVVKPVQTWGYTSNWLSIGQIKPTEGPLGVSYGIDGRARNDDYNNQADFSNQLNDESRKGRFQTRVFANINLGRNVDGFVRINNESYKNWYATCSSTTAACAGTGGVAAGKSVATPYVGGDIWFDNAYLKFKSIPGLPNTTLQVGRFDMLRGDGWFIQAGTPGAGPKNGYWDGFDLIHTTKHQQFDLIGTWDSRIDNFFPVVNQYYENSPGIQPAPGPPVNNDMGDLQALIGYYSNRMLKNTDIDGYYAFRKRYNMLPVGWNIATKFTAAGYSQYEFQPDRHMSMFGGRLVQRFPQHIIAHVNITDEIGTQDAMSQAHNNPLLPANGYRQLDIRAWGMDAFVNKYFQMKTKPYVGFLYAYLSGSDPKKPNTDGTFDLAFGQWQMTNHFGPYMEEGYGEGGPFCDCDTNPMSKEYGNNPGFFSNWEAYNFRAGFTPYMSKARYLSLEFQFHEVYAPQPYMTNAAHYSGTVTPGESLTALLTPMAGYASGAGIPAIFNCSPAAGAGGQCLSGRQKRFSEPEVDIRYQASKSLNMFVFLARENYGSFYNPHYTAALYTNGPSVTAYRANGEFARLQFNYRFTGFKSYPKM